MARLPRVVIVDVPHHVTQRGNARQVIFTSDSDRLAYLELLRQHCQLYRLSLLGRWPTQAVLWLEWGFAAGPSLPAALSRLRAVHSHSISTLPAQPVAYWRKLLHSQSSARSHSPRLTGLR